MTIQAKIDELKNNLDKDKKVVEADGYLQNDGFEKTKALEEIKYKEQKLEWE